MRKNLLAADTNQLNRRKFLKYSSLVLGSTLAVPYFVSGQNLNDKIRLACIGVAGKGDSDVNESAACDPEIVALCDVDQTALDKKAQRFPNAKKFQDFRQMLDKMGKEIDAVTISAPDHVHAIAASLAMRMGKHVFVQKPLCQTVYEARY
jgi:predicted dehydrogenase